MAHRLTRLTRLVVVVAALAAATPVAYGATGSPPVTRPDRLTVRADEPGSVDLAANDSDPDGDQLQVCRLGDLPRALSGSFIDSGQLIVYPSPRARGTYTVTYYVCDTSFLTAGTLTVTVKPPRPTFDIIPVGDAPPGRLRLVNHFKHQTFHCEWQRFDEDIDDGINPDGELTGKLDGTATVPPTSTVVIRVHEAPLLIICTSATNGVGAIFGAGQERRLTRWSAP